MPKSAAPISHDAIKRSLKSKFKLILSENRILVETINGYVKKAEKVYKEMESTEDVSPKQFAKAMEKLERAYSACVRLILVASDLFEKGDSEGSKNREVATSSCESETSVYSSESSATITDSNRARKIPAEKALQRRSKSSEVRVGEGARSKVKPQAACRKSKTIEVAENVKADTSTEDSGRLYVRPGSNSECDHLIELQRFLHGLEKEKMEADQPSPYAAIEKQLSSGKGVRGDNLSHGEPDNEQDTAEFSSSQSLAQRLKILKTAIESFKDRSSGDERVNKALNDIRDLVLKTKESRHVVGGQECLMDGDSKECRNGQPSPTSESISTENRPEAQEKWCGKECGDRKENGLKAPGSEQKQVSARDQNKGKENTGDNGKTQTKNVEDGRKQAAKAAQQVEKVQEKMQKSQQQTTGQESQPTSAPRTNIEHQSQTSPCRSPQMSDNEKEDINEIIVNKIVDMVSAKLAPRLQRTGSQDRRGFTQNGAGKATDAAGSEAPARYAKYTRSPPSFTCSEISFPQSHQQVGCCSNYRHCSQHQRHHCQQQQAEQQQEVHKIQRRQHRPKVVSFVEDYKSSSGAGPQFSTFKTRVHYESRLAANDDSPIPVSSSYAYDESDAEQSQKYQSQQAKRFSSPHKRRMYAVQQTFPTQRCAVVQRQQPQQCVRGRNVSETEDVCEGENDTEAERDYEESERDDESDIEVLKEQPQFPSQEFTKPAQSHEPAQWVNRQKSPPSYEINDYRGAHQRAQVHQNQQPQQHKTEPCVRKVVVLSPNVDSHHKDAQEREWFSSPEHAEDSVCTEGNKELQTEADVLAHFQYRYGDAGPQEQVDFTDWQAVSVEEAYTGNGDWVVTQHSPRTLITITQQQTEVGRQLPAKTPRSTPPQPQQHQAAGSYTNCMTGQSGYGKFKINEVVSHTSESSCEASPYTSKEERQLSGDTMASIREGIEERSPTSPQPEVVCIDATQLHADASRTITLSNLPLNLNEMELLNIFKKYGHVTKIYYIKDRNTGLFQGRAYGKFSKAAEAFQAAQDLQKLVIGGNEISVQLYVGTP